ncbi:hypothetical protein [Pseudomonas phage D6]|nr:hypothetical protein [Pseudomonas phage D6]
MLLDKIIVYGFFVAVMGMCAWWMLMSFYIDFTFRPKKESVKAWLKDRDWSAVIALGQDPSDIVRSAMYTNHKNRLVFDHKINGPIFFIGSGLAALFFFAAVVLIALDITGIRAINMGA